MPVPVTALYAAINGIFNVALAINVTRLRGRNAVFLGHGDSEELLTAIRRHVNNSEYLAIALVVLLAAELGGGNPMALYAIGATLTAGRLVHAIGVGSKPTPARAIGAVLTWLAIVAGGVYGAALSL
jgi:hypothetical protein